MENQVNSISIKAFDANRIPQIFHSKPFILLSFINTKMCGDTYMHKERGHHWFG